MDTDFLIIGAGPFGLAMAAEARDLGADHVVAGRPMSFWSEHMPDGMVLRSGCEWHLDPAEELTLSRFLANRGREPADAEPLPLGLYLEYAEWFRREKGIEPIRSRVTRLERRDGRFVATLGEGDPIRAPRVLLALGFAPFAHVPDEVARSIPAERRSHSRDLIRPDRLRGQRVLIVGGRQSAFESAALLAEAGAEAVCVCHRHATPSFTESDWTWVGPLLDRIANDPGWYRSLEPSERDALDRRFWVEGRLKLEPWLGPRVRHEAISIRPHTRVVGCTEDGSAIRIELVTQDADEQDFVTVDHVIFATGYRPDVTRVPLLAAGPLVSRIESRDGSPVLDDTMQTSVPGLHATSLMAARDFGLIFAFTAAVRASARIVGRAIG